jgi:hypothetical protein
MSFLASALVRPRADLRRRLDAWAKATIERLGATGAETYASIAVDGTVHRVVFVARGTKVDRARARLVLALEPDHVEVGIEAQPAAVPAIRALLSDTERSIEISSALDGLPEQFVIGTPEARGPWARASTDEIRQVLDRVEAAQRPLWLGWCVPRELALQHAGSLDDQLQDALVALGSVFTLVDLVVREGPERPDGHRPSPRSSRGERRGRRPEDSDHGGKRRARNHDRRRERDHDAVESEPEPEVEHDATPRLTRGGAGTGPAARRRSTPPRIDPRAPIDRGTLVRVMDGPFRGKVGVVQELDGKGGARVLLGLLAVRLGVEELAACAKGRERPLLSSSHRKPLPARS